MIWQIGEFSSFLYQGGFVAPLAGDGDGADAARPPGLPARPLLGVRPLRWVGVRSYGIYLWQTPIIVLTPPTRDPQAEACCASLLQVAAIFAISALSWKFVEEPIRHGAIGRFFARRRAVGWRWETFAPPMRGAIVAAGVVLVVAVAGMAGLNSASAEGADDPGRRSDRGRHRPSRRR